MLAFVAGVLAFQAELALAFEALRAGFMSTFDWLLTSADNVFVLFFLLFTVTPLGRVHLGGLEARPDFSQPAWFAMLVAMCYSTWEGRRARTAGGVR